MDHLRQGIGLRGYAQKNPKQEYKREAYEMFTAMLENVKHDVISVLSKVQIQTESEVTSIEEERRSKNSGRHEYLHPDAILSSESDSDLARSNVGSEDEVGGGASVSPRQQQLSSKPFVRVSRKVGRNEPCPCGSGKKYKQCHGKL